jgi:nucleotide-binding universal stress UspA family protein
MTKATTSRGISTDLVASARFRSLLVPLDLTPTSDRALGRLPLLPLADDARVTLLHVVPGSLPPEERQSAERDASQALDHEARHLRKLLPRKVSIEALVKRGAAAKEIAACATKLKASLIVMGRGGGRTLSDALLGSTAGRVIRQARIPVLAVRLRPRGAYVRPALALDLDPTAHEVVRLMLRVVPPPRPRVTVIHAFAAPYQGIIYPSLSVDHAQERKDELHASATHELERLLSTALARAKVRPEEAPFWRLHVRYGSARLVVEKALKKAETDLLILGTRGYTGAAYVFLGTVAGDLLRAARCDVLIVPPPPSPGSRASD